MKCKERKGKGLTDVAPGIGVAPKWWRHKERSDAQNWAWAGVSGATAVPAPNSSPRKCLRKPDERQAPGLDSIGLQTFL